MHPYIGELSIVTEPSAEPVSLSDAKAHLRVDVTDDDILITGLISAARRTFEEMNGRTLLTTTWRLVLDAWPRGDVIELPRPPLASVSSVAYVDKDNNALTFASSNYVVEANRTPGRLHLAYDKTWPTETLRPASPITITYVAGWTTPGAVPWTYRQAILLMVGHWYENRENVVVTGAVPKSIPFAFESLALLDRVY